MSETVKLIIEIPKKTIAHIRSDYGHGYKGLYDEDREIIVNAIWNSTPLDDVKAEIEEKISHYNHFQGSNTAHGLEIALEIIDKHISGEGDKE